MIENVTLVERMERAIASVDPCLNGIIVVPGIPLVVGPHNRNLLRTWLIAKGVDVNRAQKASDGTLVSAWRSPSYLATMEKASAKNLDAKALDLDADDVEEIIEKLNTTEDSTEDSADDPSVPPPSDKAKVEALNVSLDAITRAADKVLTQRLESAKDELRKFVDKRLDSEWYEYKAKLPNAIADEVARRIKPIERIIVINPLTQTKIDVGEHQHPEFSTLLTALSCGLHVMLVGGASSGKTTAAREVARILGRDFEIHGAASSAFEFKGYEDGAGKYHPSALRRAVEFGAVICMDEYNRTVPPAQMFLQSGLANNLWPFPDKTIESHPNFLCIAADNTFGTGQSRLYVSANQQDAAALDRWVFIQWEIDEDLEAKLFGDGRAEPSASASAAARGPAPPSPLQEHYHKFCIALSQMNRIRAIQALRSATECPPQIAAQCVDDFLNGPVNTIAKLTIDEFHSLCKSLGGTVPSEEVEPKIAPAIPLGDWVRHVQRIRRAIIDLGERHLVTMRASDYGGRLLKAGLSLEKVEAMCVWKGLPPETIQKIKHHANALL